ncbi:MAG: aldo/keto reductase [Christensenellaceae bacterium]|jgi:aryl-alcohol dehydrogenase-like predicted oxidoreductase|nr:aldo/keto reductase [Christensenellaceae bacterium]
MEKIRLGKTNLLVTRSAFGALPVQRLGKEEGAALLYRAYENGINFFDTANGYSDSEEKIGLALSKVRDQVIIATKTGSSTPDLFWKHLELSLTRMKTDYIDVYQFHNPRTPHGDEMVACMVKAKEQGMIRHIGVTAHRLDTATAEVESGIYETMQYPLSALSSERDLDLVRLCREKDVGVIAMKALSGGLLTSAAPSMAFLRQFDNVVPIWGFQRDSELDEVLQLEKNPPALDDAMMARIQADRAQLAGDFCRACGYCQPCPAGIKIETCARMPLLLRRAPFQNFMSDGVRADMENIENCIHCDACKGRCPYSLDTPKLLRAALEDYRAFRAEKLGAGN